MIVTIELKNDYLTVQFQEVGGALSSIKDKDGVEYLWQGDATYWSGQAPVLFPNCGSVRDDKALFGQKVGQLPRHGLVRKKTFQAHPVNDHQVKFTIEDTPEMFEQYPYHFKLSILYTLKEKSIITEYIVENLSDEVMPYFIGGHPGFNCPLLADEAYEDYYLEFENEETCTVPKQFPDTGLLDVQDRTPFLQGQKTLDLDFKIFEKDAVTLDQLSSRSIRLKSKKHDKGIQLQFKDFPHLILWSTTNKGPFIALEPWSGLSTSLEESDQFDQKRDVSFVEPKQADQKSFVIEVLGI